MNAFDLQTPSRLAEWYIALAIGFTCAFVAFVLLDKITPHSAVAFWLIWPIATLYLSTTSQSIQILNCNPPVLVSLTVWFGVIKSERRLELPGLA